MGPTGRILAAIALHSPSLKTQFDNESHLRLRRLQRVRVNGIRWRNNSIDDSVIAVVQEIGCGKVKGKAAGLEEIKRWLFQRKESFEKTRF